MPRPFRLVRSLSESELQRALQGQTNLRIRERIQTILLLYNRHTVTEAARRIGRSRSAVQGWLKRWNTRGLDGLRPAFKGRHPNILLEDMDKALNELVANGGATTVSNLLSHISRTRNLNYSFNGVLKVLKRTRRIGQGRTVVYERTHFPSNTADPDDHLQRGHVLALRAHGPGEWSSEAKNEALVVLEKEPDSHEAICLLGRIAEKERHVEAAGDYYIFALERNPNYPLAKQDLARVISQLLPIRQIERWGSEEVSPGEKSRFDKALRIYEKALKKGITFLDYPSLHHRLALGFWRSLEKTNALEQESLALRLDPQEPEYHYWKGRILEELRATAVRNEQILKEYNAAIELVEKSGKISGYERSEKSHIYHQRKRALLLRLGKIDEAVKETLAIPQNWSLPEQLIECSVRYAMDSKWDAAESLLVRAMKDGHVDNRTLFYRALGQRNQSRGRNRIVLTKLLESEKLSTMFRPRSSN